MQNLLLGELLIHECLTYIFLEEINMHNKKEEAVIYFIAIQV